MTVVVEDLHFASEETVVANANAFGDADQIHIPKRHAITDLQLRVRIDFESHDPRVSVRNDHAISNDDVTGAIDQRHVTVQHDATVDLTAIAKHLFVNEPAHRQAPERPPQS